MSYAKHLNRANTPQTEPLNSRQVKNNAGGFTYEVTNWDRLDRFLMLGSEGGSYYSSERTLTLDNVDSVLACVAEDGLRVLNRTLEVSDKGLAVKNDPAILVLALALKEGGTPTRQRAAELVPKICRTFTHLATLMTFLKQLGGFGRVTKRAISNWYHQSPEKVEYQMIKYRNRNGWTHRDVLRQAHVKPQNDAEQALFHFATTGEVNANGAQLERVQAFLKAQTADKTTLINLIQDHNLPRECVPTQYLDDPDVWAVLLEKMPVMAMIRNVSTMTRNGLLRNSKEARRKVASTLTDKDALVRSRIHPLFVLNALRTYTNGQGMRSTWNPISGVTDALDDAFYLSFHSLPKIDKSILVGLDVSGSMSGYYCAGLPALSAREASAAMLMTHFHQSDDVDVMGFSNKFIPLNLSRKQRLDDVIRTISNLPFGATDCALPMLHAKEQNLKKDAFVIYTDNETWFGNTHPQVALNQYQKTVQPAKLAVVAMTASLFSIADPQRSDMMDVVGADANLPAILQGFIDG